MNRLAHGLPSDSFGLFFESLTEAFGHVPSRDEGKLTGLAAHGHGGNVKEDAPFIFKDGHIRYRGPHGLQAVRWIKNHLLATYSRVDVAAWAQENLEMVMVAAARHWLAQTGETCLALGGGTFGNVKLNQRLHELPEVTQLYVAPNMGDGGNAAGALAGAGCLDRHCLGDAFLGDLFSDSEIEGELKQSGMPYEHIAETSEAIAGFLHQGKTVARFDGRMEWGPRALGNRSILAPATDSAVVERLNGQLRRSDFMPFAPAILAEEASSLLANHEAGLLAGEFMTVCFDCSPRMKAACPAVVHVDGTARAQIVHASKNPGLHGILSAYARQSGIGVLLNTSFNIHEEPIVRTPHEALRSFREAGLDFLAIGPYIVRQGG